MSAIRIRASANQGADLSSFAASCQSCDSTTAERRGLDRLGSLDDLPFVDYVMHLSSLSTLSIVSIFDIPIQPKRLVAPSTATICPELCFPTTLISACMRACSIKSRTSWLDADKLPPPSRVLEYHHVRAT